MFHFAGQKNIFFPEKQQNTGRQAVSLRRGQS
jgi:hypothetical protein